MYHAHFYCFFGKYIFFYLFAVVKPGYCPHMMTMVCQSFINGTCQADVECSGNQKCCKTACGDSICTGAVMEPGKVMS